MTPKALCAIALFALSFGLGDAALILLLHSGVDFLVSFAAFFVVFAGVYAGIAPLILRLRPKDVEQPRLANRRA